MSARSIFISSKGILSKKWGSQARERKFGRGGVPTLAKPTQMLDEKAGNE